MQLVKVIEPRPVFESYVARCTERPAFKRSLAQLDEALTTSLGTDPFGRLVPAYNGGVALSP